ncbi:hypothetical protein [Sulfurospirillum diekertiae]|uniref:MarR family transcriptional regulator n=1 Tax=Sulfurospirillum diekertiae TaxID=1854492 RepID=A0A1Y0HJ73_9BACT|nr:hypothetical protein [Sulfurospirillum diekertiae]ARU48159.1 hypothetical protein Sdiek1_0993 [Sulfurospirillum diekertiae]ASC93002.1 hypothetical protein Sdiek2_0981 [Sulfurospirillum diekertiae]
MKTKEQLFNYIRNHTQWHIEDKELHIAIPLYIKSAYELYNTSIDGFGVLFAKVKENSFDVRMHYNAVKKLETLCPCRVVLVFEKLKPTVQKSLMSKQVPFIVVDSQIFMPFAFTQVQTPSVSPAKQYQKLSPNADLILIGYLDEQIQNGMMIKEVACLIQTELRATSIGLDILASLGYLHIEKEGVSKKVYFISRAEVYEKLEKEAVSPLKYVVYSKVLPHLEIFFSGYSALAHYSSLMDDSLKTIAVAPLPNKSTQLDEIACDRDDAQYMIEVWDRNPAIFSKNQAIHPLYLLRYFRHNEDERTQEALKNIKAIYKGNL